MAKKIPDFVYSLIFGIFVFSSLATFIYNADNLYTNNEGIGNVLTNISDEARDDYLNTEISAYDSTFETGTFLIPEDQQFETRGTDTAVLLTKNNPSTATNAITKIFGYITIHPLISTLIISLIIITSSILIIRLFLGDGRA